MTTWRWIGSAVAIAVHDEQLAEHGGAVGLRDGNLLESALARPQHVAAYDTPDAARLAASYAAGIIQNHPFVDGNKRTALMAANIFLLDHGFDITAGDIELFQAFTALADGSLSEADFAVWLRSNIGSI